jgi:hypothetical protein
MERDGAIDLSSIGNLGAVDQAVLDTILRFLVGGFMVCLFATIGDILEPKSFAGLFGAAPSIALASLGLAVAAHGASPAAIECRSMVIGAIAFTCYSAAVTTLIARFHVSAMKASLGALGVWFGVALGLWFLLLH